MTNERLQQYRFFLKDTIRKQTDFSRTDQSLGVPPPPEQKPCNPDVPRIDLASPKTFEDLPRVGLLDAMRSRKSHRRFSDLPLSLEELSFLLWVTQGVRRPGEGASCYRTVPSAGARHAFETYVCALRVEGLEEGVYRYLPLDHQLVCEFKQPGLSAKLTNATLGQRFAGEAAATFAWTTIPYRTEWRYGLAAHKVIALDAGHVCQNLYLACEGIGAGTCAIAAYDQDKMDALLGVDGEEEYTIYVAPVGKVGT